MITTYTSETNPIESVYYVESENSNELTLRRMNVMVVKINFNDDRTVMYYSMPDISPKGLTFVRIDDLERPSVN